MPDPARWNGKRKIRKIRGRLDGQNELCRVKMKTYCTKTNLEYLDHVVYPAKIPTLITPRGVSKRSDVCDAGRSLEEDSLLQIAAYPSSVAARRIREKRERP
eukprot:scaffold2381_cov143-Skeletonema_menzelii.AAC.16